ncbi:unnamed protein product [Prunus armeniaca]
MLKKAFVHGDLEEEVYVDLPPRCNIAHNKKNKVCKLRKSLYRLKQSPRAGFGRFTKSVKNFGYTQREQQKLQKYLSREFEMKDLGALKYFLGIEIARSKTSIFLSQRKYVMDLLTETGMFGCKPADTSIEMNHKLCEDMDRVPTNKEQYQPLLEVDIILRYLKSAPGKGLMFSKNGNLEVVGYTDVNWAGCITDRCSTLGYLIFIGGNLVTW